MKLFVQTAATTAAIATLLMTAVPPQAIAHHGWSEYNSQNTRTVTGVIQKVTYESPHTVIQLKSGNKVWTTVLAPPARMERRGLPQTGLKVGQTVTVVGYPHRKDTNEMRAERIKVGDRTVELR